MTNAIVVPKIPDMIEIKRSDTKGIRYLLKLVNDQIFESEYGVFKSCGIVYDESNLLQDWLEYQKGGYVSIELDENTNKMKVFYVPKEFVKERHDLLIYNDISIEEGRNEFVDLLDKDAVMRDDRVSEWKRTDPEHFEEIKERFRKIREASYWKTYDLVFE